MDASNPGIKRGWLKVQKKTAFFSSWKPRYIVLDLGQINYYKKRLPLNEKPYGDIEKGGMILQDVIMIEKLTYNTIELIVKSGKEKHLVLLAENINDTMEWRNAFKSHIYYMKLNNSISSKSDASYSSGMSKQISFKVSHGLLPTNFNTTTNNQASTTSMQASSVSTTPAVSRQGSPTHNTATNNSSPINRSRSGSTTSQTTAGTDYITPLSGFVMKNKNNKNERVFINVCHHSSVPVTSLQTGLFGGTSKWPFMISPPGRLEENYHAHRHTTNNNNTNGSISSSKVKDEVMVYDVVMHTSVVELIMLDNNAPTRDMVCARVIECINSKHKGNLTGQFSLPNIEKKYVGQVDFISLMCNNPASSATDTNRSIQSSAKEDSSKNNQSSTNVSPERNPQSNFTISSFIRTSSSRLLLSGSSSINNGSSNNLAALNSASTTTASSTNSSPIRSSQQKQIAALTLVQPTHSSLNNPITGANISPIRSSQQRLAGSNSSPLRNSQQKTGFTSSSSSASSSPSSNSTVGNNNISQPNSPVPLQSAMSSSKDALKSNDNTQSIPPNSPFKKSASFRLRFDVPNGDGKETESIAGSMSDRSPSRVHNMMTHTTGVVIADTNQMQIPPPLPLVSSQPLQSTVTNSGKVSNKSNNRRKSCIVGVTVDDNLTSTPSTTPTSTSISVEQEKEVVVEEVMPSKIATPTETPHMMITSSIIANKRVSIIHEGEEEEDDDDDDDDDDEEGSSRNLFPSAKMNTNNQLNHDNNNSSNNNMMNDGHYISSSTEALLTSQMLFTLKETDKSDSESTVTSALSHTSPRQQEQQERQLMKDQKGDKPLKKDNNHINNNIDDDDDDDDDMWGPAGMSITYTACGMECSIQ